MLQVRVPGTKFCMVLRQSPMARLDRMVKKFRTDSIPPPYQYCLAGAMRTCTLSTTHDTLDVQPSSNDGTNALAYLRAAEVHSSPYAFCTGVLLYAVLGPVQLATKFAVLNGMCGCTRCNSRAVLPRYALRDLPTRLVCGVRMATTTASFSYGNWSSLQYQTPIVLRASYAVSGTDIAYAAATTPRRDVWRAHSGTGGRHTATETAIRFRKTAIRPRNSLDTAPHSAPAPSGWALVRASIYGDHGASIYGGSALVDSVHR
eukprot:462835-Rhodomonas_salina.4